MRNPGSGPEVSKSMQRLLPRRSRNTAGHKMVAWVIRFYMLGLCLLRQMLQSEREVIGCPDICVQF